MREINKIKDYKKKRKVLQENGWIELWYEDNWIKEEWKENPMIDINICGIPTNRAYRSIVPFELDRDDLNKLHDLVLAVTYDILGEPKHMNDEELRELWKNLPRGIREIGMDFGLSDDSFRKLCDKFLEKLVKSPHNSPQFTT